MMNHRHGNTATEMKNDGTWSKLGRKHYQHIDGAVVRYDGNRWAWQLVGAGRLDGFYSTLWVAKHYAEKAGAAQGVQ